VCYRVVDDVPRGVAEQGGPHLAVRLHPGLGQLVHGGRDRDVGVAQGLVHHGHAGLDRDLAFPQVQDPDLAVGEERQVASGEQRPVGRR